MKPPVSNPDLNPKFFRFDEIRVQINWVHKGIRLHLFDSTRFVFRKIQGEWTQTVTSNLALTDRKNVITFNLKGFSVQGRLEIYP